MGMSDFFPFSAMVVVQVGYAGMNIASRLAMDYANMKPLVMVAYCQIFATIATIPFAYFLERRTRPKMSMSVLFQIFICSLTGITGNQVLFFVGLHHSSLTVSTAFIIILPAVTIILAAIFRQESVGIKKISGQAKVLGTLLCVGGAMFLTFYNGPIINIGESSINWKYANKSTDSADDDNSNSVLGPLIVIASTVSWAVWYITQAKVSKKFPAPYTSTLLMFFFGSIQWAVIAVSINHKSSDWSLISPLRLVATLYAGIVCSALAFSLTSWTIQRKEALYFSVFCPLLLIIVAILSWALLHEKIYVGTVVGSVLIVMGLYAVLWGKDKEAKLNNNNNNKEQEERQAGSETNKEESEEDDIESQLSSSSSANQDAQVNNDETKKKAAAVQHEEIEHLQVRLPSTSINNNNNANFLIVQWPSPYLIIPKVKTSNSHILKKNK